MTFPWTPKTRVRMGPAPSICHVLYAFDGPRMVLARDEQGRQILGIAADEDDAGTTRWVFAPAPPERVLSLLKTRSGLRGLFESALVEIHDLQTRWEESRSWAVSPDEVPEDLLPERDAELPELEGDIRDALIAEQQRYLEQRARVARTRMLFSGRPVRGRRGIAASFAAETLSSYQALVSLTFGQRQKGSLSSTGPIPAREASTLLITEMPRGSVGFELVEDVLQESVLPSGLSEVVAQVGSLLDAAATSDAAYAEAVAEFDPRVASELHRFFDKLKKAEASLKLEVSHREYVFDEKRLADAVDRTASTPRQEDDRPVLGTLIGLLPMDHRFELQTEDGGVLKGKIARETDPSSLLSFFQKPCLAHLRVVTVERFGETAEAFTLVSVEALPAPPTR